MKIGLFGGTFDPLHLGHLMLAEAARETCDLQEVWFIPAWSPPQKQGHAISPPKHRLEMVRLGIAGHPQFRVSRIELERQGISYTVDTLRQVAQAHPDDELFLLIGGDSLHDLPTWHQPREILELATVIAVNRGRTPADPEPVLKALGEKYRSRIVLNTMPGVDLSATEIRARVAAGQSIRYQTPRSVELYVSTHQLYRPAR